VIDLVPAGPGDADAGRQVPGGGLVTDRVHEQAQAAETCPPGRCWHRRCQGAEASRLVQHGSEPVGASGMQQVEQVVTDWRSGRHAGRRQFRHSMPW
jgi:hypothetical protein